MKLYIACDHAAIEMKDEITAYLREKGHDVEDLGINIAEKIDYPVAAEKVARKVVSDGESRGILICGTGIGMSMCANKHRGIRAALCNEAESTAMTRHHNNSNVLCLGARMIPFETALELTKVFLTTEFDGGRHERRVKMLDNLL